MKNQVLLIGLIVGVAITSGGCGSSSNQSLVSSVALRSYAQDGDTYIEVSSMMKLGNTQLVSFELPIVDPHHVDVVYGKIAVRQAFAGGAEVALSVNLTDAARLNLIEGILPNGTLIPVGGLGSTPVIGIPVGNSGARVYVAWGTGVALVGFAIPIKEFDSMGSNAGYVNIFPMFDFGKGVKGIAGIFTGSQSKQSGIAFFVDAGSALNPVPAAPAPTGTQKLLAASLASSAKINAAPAIQPTTLKFRSVGASSDATDAVNYGLYKLHKKRTALHAVVK